jgi:hypothetical protein
MATGREAPAEHRHQIRHRGEFREVIHAARRNAAIVALLQRQRSAKHAASGIDLVDGEQDALFYGLCCLAALHAEFGAEADAYRAAGLGLCRQGGKCRAAAQCAQQASARKGWYGVHEARRSGVRVWGGLSKNFAALAAAGTRLVECQQRAVEQAGHVLAVIGKPGATQAGGDDDFLFFKHDSLMQGVEQLGAKAADVVRLGHAGREQHEVVGIEARHGVGFTHRGHQPVGDRTQYPVAGQVPVVGVDRSEAVDVDAEQAETVRRSAARARSAVPVDLRAAGDWRPESAGHGGAPGNGSWSGVRICCDRSENTAI